MGLSGLEPPTSRLSGVRSNLLSYKPAFALSRSDDKKFDFTALFSDEGKQQVVDWINAQYEEHPELWSHEKKTIFV